MKKIIDRFSFNNLDLNNWRNYKNDITTDSLWVVNKKKDDGKFVIPKRDFFPKNSSTFQWFIYSRNTLSIYIEIYKRK